MDYLLKVLGSGGSKTKTNATVSLQIADNMLIDAGNIFQKYEFDTNKIEHVFISHSHFDHILELPFLIENGFTTRTKQLHIYGLQDTIANIKKFMFNDYIWPDFSLIPLLTTGEKSIVFNEIEFGTTLYINDISITPIPANHIVPTAGFVIEKNDRAFALSSDTYLNNDFWKTINENRKIDTVLVEISFESALNGLAQISKHLTPQLLDRELEKLKRDDLEIYIYHVKESSIPAVTEELKNYSNLKKFDVKFLPEQL
jgi:cAMP phosphodiesterase